MSATIARQYQQVRAQTMALVEGLSDADATVQSMADASPAKWHLAHTTWFFETFILAPRLCGYRAFDERFGYLFNSYYEAVGARHPRPRRGLLSRPDLDTIRSYRVHVDTGMRELLDRQRSAERLPQIELGLHHEQQHQELLLTDILHLFAQSPLLPAYRPLEHVDTSTSTAGQTSWASFEGGVVEIGHAGAGFAFDLEEPRHAVLLQPFALARRLVTNAEWLAFMDDGGYRSPSLWMSDGWEVSCREGWNAPLYWERRGDAWWSMTLRGPQPIDPAAPVCHVSWFEADAFARWSNARLPTEEEWEVASGSAEIDGVFMESGRLRPAPAPTDSQDRLLQLFGDAWEWTASPFRPYPGFKPAPGALGEYNGKFMNGQYVLRGGSCVSPRSHIRATYRNFFQPEKRWQFAGLRLARDLSR